MKERKNIDNKNDFSFTKINYMLFSIGILFILIGYLIMYTGETTSFQSTKLSPIILIFGYCIIIPISNLYKK